MFSHEILRGGRSKDQVTAAEINFNVLLIATTPTTEESPNTLACSSQMTTTDLQMIPSIILSYNHASLHDAAKIKLHKPGNPT
jgi:hypothetical protein